jgi:hypothetical protein
MTKPHTTTNASARNVAGSHVEAEADAEPKMRVSQAALAAAALADLDALGAKLGLAPAMSAEERRALTPGLCVPNAFTEGVAALATRHAELAGGFDADEAREAIAFAAAYAPVARAAHELGARIESQMAARRGAVGSRALDTYAMWKGLARTKAGAALRDSLKGLSAMFSHSRARRAKTTPDAAPIASA